MKFKLKLQHPLGNKESALRGKLVPCSTFRVWKNGRVLIVGGMNLRRVRDFLEQVGIAVLHFHRWWGE